MKDKYNMTVQENILLAKRNIVNNIYSSAKLEGLNVTFPETYAIFEKAKMENVDISTVSTILNLKHAWQFLLSNLDKKIDLEFIKQIHSEVAKDEALFWGELRNGNVGIAGTDYIPPIPDTNEVINKLNYYNSLKDITNRSIDRMLWMMKSQLFWDGNKRTSMLIANKDLISNGKGIISIGEKYIFEFNQLLSNFYSYDSKEELKNFLLEKCLDGLEVKLIKKDRSEPVFDR